MVISLQKWVGSFVLATLLAVVIQTFSISFGAGRLLEKVENQAVAILEMKAEMKTEFRDVRQEMKDIRQEMKTEFHDLRQEIKDIRKDTAIIREELQKFKK